MLNAGTRSTSGDTSTAARKGWQAPAVARLPGREAAAGTAGTGPDSSKHS
jgi:hypothetical protein